MVDLAVTLRDQEGLVDACHNAPSGQRGLGDDGERRMHLVTVHGQFPIRGSGDDAVLRTPIQAAPQVISREAGLEAHLDAGAVGRERDGVGVMADQGVDVCLGRGDAVRIGNCVHRPSIG